MQTFEERRQAIIQRVFLENDYFLDLDTKLPEGVQVPEYLTEFTDNVYLQLNLIADLSFKLYILNHTKNENDLHRAIAYCELLSAFRALCELPNAKKMFEMTLIQIKMVYPVLGNDTVLHELRDFFMAIVNRTNACNPLKLLCISTRLADHSLGANLAMQRCIKMIHAHKKRSNQSLNCWPEIEKIFQIYASELSKNPDVKFGVYFYGKRDGHLEAVLRKYEEWSPVKYLKKLARNETLSENAERNYKKWKTNFDRWYTKNKKLSKEAELTACFQKYFWNKVSTVENVVSIQKQINPEKKRVDSAALDDLKEMVKQLSLKVLQQEEIV